MTNFQFSTVSQAFIAAALAVTAFASVAQSPKQKGIANPPAVAAFYADAMHCADMAAVNENQTDEEAQRFTVDIDKAVAALLAKTPSMSRDRALMHLKAGCDAQLLADAKAPLDGTKPKLKQ